jgi:xanthine dehydrogenase FAD-binding subunit
MVEALRPRSLPEALALRARHGAIPFAGGTDLMVRLRRGAGALPGFTAPVLFLDLCRELARIEERDGSLEIGAMATLESLAEHPRVHSLLREAILSMGAPALRSVATLGGNVCNASPAGDTLPFLYAFEARVRLASPSSERTIALEEFITGPGRTALAPEELLIAVLVPAWSPSVSCWRKVGTRKANALTKVSVAAFADIADGRITRARVALGAVGPVVIRARAVERLLEGAAASGLPSLRGAIREAAADAARPIDDQRSTAEYRREVAASLVAGFVDQMAAAAMEGRTPGGG